MSNILPKLGLQVLHHVSANLRRFRRERGLSQERLAASAGLSRRMIHGIENGAANVSLATVDRLSAALGVTFTQMVRPPEASDNTRLGLLGWQGGKAESRAVLLGAAPGKSETELWLWSLAPGETFDSEEIAASWHEMLLVIKGELTLAWGDRSDVITASDYRIFTSEEPYCFQNTSNEVVVYLRALVL